MVLGFMVGNERWVGEVVYVLLFCAGEKRDSVELQ